MKKMLLLGTMAVALLAAGTAFAGGLSLNGETGLARTPLAMTSAPMSLAIAADYVTSKDAFVPVRLNFGIIEGLEVAAKYWWTDTAAELKDYGIGAKYVLPFKFVDGLGIAVGGAYDVLSMKGVSDTKTIGVYAVASYTLEAGIPIIPSAGFAWSSVDNGSSESGFNIFASVVAKVMPNLAVGGELVTKNSNSDLNDPDADMDIWLGARYMDLVPNLTLQAGLINNANMGGKAKDWTIHAGVQYSFGFGR